MYVSDNLTFVDDYFKCNFPVNPYVRLLVAGWSHGRLVCQSVMISWLEGSDTSMLQLEHLFTCVFSSTRYDIPIIPKNLIVNAILAIIVKIFQMFHFHNHDGDSLNVLQSKHSYQRV